jgi:hypothetical protein
MKTLLLIPCLAAFSLFANENEKTQIKHEEKLSRVYVGGYGSYGTIDGAYSTDGEYVQYRFTLGVDAYRCDKWALGFEGGVQSGNSMPIDASTSLINQAGGLQPQATLKPLLDLLATVRWSFVGKWSLLIKGGVAYRQMQWIDRTSSEDSLKKFNGEFQGGFGYQLTKHARLVGLYQGIYSNNNVSCSLDSQLGVKMHHIPTQQAGLFGIEYQF